ncbi:hypothetical protein GYMLUDRAFT_41359 [Collybiopsis luxurians FD-317 M1]|uniref:Unplaced genomic scaffold GYMLUscaffold_17, whole genome shotgun sequence n=1 Tax=Collybiopsis luxurians FD-317 M1 TaxID=944289 RepID=A0A0D0BGN5_9AGAR|nr:hypothetical protein GYMLUDRAFT_41359 [Collybiopsis luxurians FD-317 M1]
MPPQQLTGGTGYQPTGALGGGGSGFMSPSSFQPSSSFGQQMLGGSSYGYLQGQNTSPSIQTAYNPVQQQLQSPVYSNVSQFDPYSSIGQGWDGANPSQQQQQQQSPYPSSSSFQSPVSPITPMTTSRSSSGGVHPREFIKTHKTEIESWDTYAWKQLLSCFDDLKENWGKRRKEIDGRAQQLLVQMQYSGGYNPQIQQEGERLRALSREADLNHDSIAASSFQMHEVFENYRSSGDAASKRRVREASNAALQSLPDWPAPTF